MTDLTEMVEWLRGVVTGDLQRARAAGWDHPGCSQTWTVWRGTKPYERSHIIQDKNEAGVAIIDPEDSDAESIAVHIATHDPADTIARCEAELKLIDRHIPEPLPSGMPPLYCGTGEEWHVPAVEVEPPPGHYRWVVHKPEQGWCVTLRDLAYGRRHRPGWKETWKP